jgi:AraC family transcriptional regulator
LDVRQYSLSQAVIDGRTPFRPLGRPHAFLTTVGGVGPAEFESGSGAHNFNLQLSAPLLVAVRGDRRASTSLVAPGQVSLNVAGEQFRCVVWPRPGNQALHVALPPGWVAEVAEREGVTGGSPRPMLGRWEPRLRTLALRLVDGLRRGVSADRLWGDEWYQRLAVELLRAGRTGQPSAPPAGRLTAPVVRRVVDYLEAHLGVQVSLAELAQFGGLSQYHFARAFRATLGVSPHRYLTELRLQRARHLIATSRLPLSDIAFAVGFASLSHFSTAFRGHVGCSPSQFRAATG